METATCLKSDERHKITFGTKEWADYNVNCIKGCYNDCRYCYARMMAKRFNRSSDSAWKNMLIRREILIKNFRKFPDRVMFPSTHDIFDIFPFKEACISVLWNLLRSGNVVLITTKPRFVIVREIIHQFDHYKKQIQFRFTLTSYDDYLLEFWEPNAPSFKERLMSLEYASEKGFKTSVSIEPFLDYDPAQLVEIIRPFTTESIWIGKMNYISRKNLCKREKLYYDRVRQNYTSSHLLGIYSKLRKCSRVRFKDSIRIKLQLPRC